MIDQTDPFPYIPLDSSQYIIISMKDSDYEKLMERLNPWGFYQKRLYLLSCVWWATTGIAKETIELGLQ
jgi:hypothetical protein